MKPLEGRRILVTRARDQAEELRHQLAEAGAEVVLFPTIEIQPVEDLVPLDRALARLSDFAWIGFTSVNGVRIFWDRLRAGGRTSLPREIRIAAVGSATARALADLGVAVNFVPEQFVGDRLAEGMGELAGRRVLLPRAAGAREALVETLAARGALVEDLAIYRSVAAVPSAGDRAELERGVEVATFTSASTVTHFAALTGGRPGATLRGALVACLGPLTADAARGVGLRVSLVPKDSTMNGLVAALIDHYQGGAAAPGETSA